jgi:hypothetical protein
MTTEYRHNATEIQAMVRNMDASKEKHASLQYTDPENYLKNLGTDNTVLYEFYPAIFAMHADNKLDDTFFYMLKEKRKMEKGETNEDDASIRVGQKLFNTWVDPIINHTAPAKSLSYSEYYSKNR